MMNDVDFNNLSPEDLLAKIENGEIGDGIITLLSVAEPSATANIMPTYDDFNNKWKGIPNLSEEAKKKLDFYLEKDSNTIVKHGTKFNLNTLQGRAYWDMIKYSRLIAYSAAQADIPGVMFYVEMPTVEAKKSVDKERLRNKAVGMILNDTYDNLKHRATVFNITDPEDYKHESLQELLINIAKKDPKRVLEIYGSNVLSIRLLIDKALKANVITEDGGLFKYGIHIIGANEEGMIASLSHPDNEFLLSKIKQHYDDLMGEKLFTKEEVEQPKVVASEIKIDTNADDSVESFNQSSISGGEIEWHAGEELPDNLVQLKKIARNLGADPIKTEKMNAKKNVIKIIEELIKSKS